MIPGHCRTIFSIGPGISGFPLYSTNYLIEIVARASTKLFYLELKSNKILPKNLQKKNTFKNNYMACGGTVFICLIIFVLDFEM